jgi:hypothetical protein
LKRLHDGGDEELTDVLSRHQPSEEPDWQAMDLLPNMAPFRLGRPIDAGKKISYIGGIDVSALLSGVSVPHPEYADFTDKEGDTDSDGEWSP